RPREDRQRHPQDARLHDRGRAASAPGRRGGAHGSSGRPLREPLPRVPRAARALLSRAHRGGLQADREARGRLLRDVRHLGLRLPHGHRVRAVADREGRRRHGAGQLLLPRPARRPRQGPLRLLQEARDAPRGRREAPPSSAFAREEEEVKRDYSRLLTEQRNPRTSGIDALSIPEIIDLLNREDAAIADAVGAEKAKIARAVNLLVDRVKKGGRIFFVGAGTSGRLGVLEAAELPPTFDTPSQLAQAIMAGGPECVWASKEGAEDDDE